MPKYVEHEKITFFDLEPKDQASFIILSVIAGSFIPALIAVTIIDYNKAKPYTTITVKDGIINVTENEFTGWKNAQYQVVEQSDDSLTINVYCDYIDERQAFTEYLVNNIDIKENADGTYSVDFDSNHISYIGYKRFTDEKNNENYQRKRS